MPPRAKKTTAPARKRQPAPANVTPPPVAPAVPVQVSVLVPWRDTDTDRALAWAYVAALWAERHPDWEVIEGTPPDGPWCKAAAVADAFGRAKGEVLVIADADVWCDGVGEAVAAVQAGAPWAIPHHRVLRLTSVASADVYASGAWPTRRTATTYAQPPYPGRPGGGIVVLPRSLYETAPLDHRFVGWGQEDDAWALALRLLGGKEWRGTADLWHLWHRAQPRQSRTVGSAASLALHRRYSRAARDRGRMATLVGEIR